MRQSMYCGQETEMTSMSDFGTLNDIRRNGWTRRWIHSM